LDTLTHALSGALIARATAPKDPPPASLPRRLAAGFLAAAAPDLDFVLSYVGPVTYLEHHRGVTHSVLLLPLWALALSWLLAKILREPGGWRTLYGVCALGLATHILGDVITSFGTIVFAPFSDWRAAIGTTFIIDPWFTGIIVAGLVASLFLRKTRLPAAVASAVLAGYVGFQYLQKQNALQFAERYAHAHGFTDALITAQPRPVSPFNWTVFVSNDREHRFAHVNVVRREPRRLQPGDGFIARIDSAYLPLDRAQWEVRPRYGAGAIEESAREAWSSPALGFFRWFAALPAFDGVSEGSTCVWFVDLRFLTPGRDNLPFRFGACRDKPADPWQAYQRSESGTRVPLPR
jgi:inner membrane protein